MIKNTSRFLITGLLIAWFVDFLFYKKPFGIAFTLWVVIALAGLIIISYLEKVKPHWLTFVLAGFAIALSSASFLRMEPFTQTISALASLAILMLLTITFRDGHWPYFRLLDYVLRGLKWLLTIFSRPLPVIFQGQKKNNQEGRPFCLPSRQKLSAFWN